MELKHRGALVSGSITKPSLPCMLNVTHQPLSFAICIMRPLKSVTTGPPATPAHFILQRPVSVTPKRFHMSTLTWLLIFCLQNAASQPCFQALDGLPKALEHTAFLGPLVKGPLQQKHNTQGGGPCGNISLPSLLGSQQCLRTMWVYFGSAGCGECYHSQGTPSPVLTAYSGPSRRMHAAGIIWQGGLPPALIPPRVPSSKKGFRFQRNEKSVSRDIAVFNCWSGELSRAEGPSRVTRTPTDGRHLLFNLEPENSKILILMES